LQKGIPEEEYLNPDINIKLISRKNEYTKFKDFHIFIGNYNLSGRSIDNAIDIVNWLISYKENPLDKNMDLNVVSPEFYILGFQEIVDLNSAHLLIKSNTEKKNKIKTLINNLLITTFQNPNKDDKYQIMKELDLVGLYILIFVRSSCIKYIKNFDYQIIKTGLKGALGNKGSLLLRFNLNDTNIALACSHLSSGQDKNEERKSEIINVLNTTFKKYPSVKFKDYNYYFYFGDVNTRLDLTLDNPKLIELVQKHSEDINNEFNDLLQYDQFNKYQKESNIIAEMDEAKIKFSPTYKYFVGKCAYDIEKRIPSWCDRIFFKKYSETVPLAYNKCLLTVSDHQPIYGLYKIKTEIIDKDKRSNILDEILKENKDNNSNDIKDNIDIYGNQMIFNKNEIIDNFFTPNDN
jgi:phosphatidylinositol-bisphosphatase